MIENISKKQEKIQEKVQKQQELNDKDCRELTDEELDQIVGGTFMPSAVTFCYSQGANRILMVFFRYLVLL